MEKKLVIARGMDGGTGEMGKLHRKIQTCSFIKKNKPWDAITSHCDYS